MNATCIYVCVLYLFVTNYCKLSMNVLACMKHIKLLLLLLFIIL